MFSSFTFRRSVVFIQSLLVAISWFATISFAADPDTEPTNNWLAFRGDSTSASKSTAPETLVLGSEGNLAWRIEMPGESVAGPIVIGDLVVSTGSSGQDGERLHISGVDLADGSVSWQQTFFATGRPYCHPTSANAAPTPTSDGKRIIAFFSSSDLVCLSLDGELLWYRGLGHDYPKAGNDVGMASSPLIAEGAVIVQVEAQGDSFAAAIDIQTGKNLWRIDRPKQSNWSSPVAIQRPDGSTQVILQSRDDAIAVNPRTGDLIWSTTEAGSGIASPTIANGFILFPGDDLTAMDIGSSASMQQTRWSDNKLSPKNASVVVQDDRIYSLKGSVLIAASLELGDKLWQTRLTDVSNPWATPVISDDKLYIFDQSGIGLVVRDLGESSETISVVDLGDPVLGSPAISKGRLIVRSKHSLFCFE